MGAFDLISWGLMTAALWAGFRIQALGLANPHLASKSFIGLALPVSVLVLLVAFGATWWLHSFLLAFTTVIASVVSVLLLYAIGFILNPILYYVVALAAWAGYCYRILQSGA